MGISPSIRNQRLAQRASKAAIEQMRREDAYKLLSYYDGLLTSIIRNVTIGRCLVRNDLWS